MRRAVTENESTSSVNTREKLLVIASRTWTLTRIDTIGNKFYKNKNVALDGTLDSILYCSSAINMDFDRDAGDDNVDHIHGEDEEMEEQYVSNIDMTSLYVHPNTYFNM